MQLDNIALFSLILVPILINLASSYIYDVATGTINKRQKQNLKSFIGYMLMFFVVAAGQFIWMHLQNTLSANEQFIALATTTTLLPVTLLAYVLRGSNAFTRAVIVSTIVNLATILYIGLFWKLLGKAVALLS
jgi:hypothetical protein